MPETNYITYNFKMKQENIDFLEANKQHLSNAQDDFFKNLDGNTRLRFQQIMAEEFRPGYTNDLWCDKCCLQMIKDLATHFQQWKDAQPKEEPMQIQEAIEEQKPKEKVQVKEEPVISTGPITPVKATFPVNDPPEQPDTNVVQSTPADVPDTNVGEIQKPAKTPKQLATEELIKKSRRR